VGVADFAGNGVVTTQLSAKPGRGGHPEATSCRACLAEILPLSEGYQRNLLVNLGSSRRVVVDA
jgi:hypothetical protein